MKVKLYKLSLGLAASMVLFTALPAHAQINKYGCIYAVDPYGTIVRDPYGNCIRTPYWTAEKNIPECGGTVAVVEPAAPVVETVSLGADAFFDFDKYNLKPEHDVVFIHNDSLGGFTINGHGFPATTPIVANVGDTVTGTSELGIFQRGDPARNGGVRASQPTAGQRVAASARDLHEEAHVIPVKQTNRLCIFART